MRVLIIGGSGFIGRAIVEELLLDPSNEVHVLDRQIQQHAQRENLTYHTGDVNLRQFGSTTSLEWDYVVNMAGILGTSEMFDDLSSIVENIQGVLNVLDQIKTGTVLYPIMPEVWLSPYAVSKISTRLIHEMYAQHLNRKSIMVRLYNVYGPGQKWEPVHKIIPQFIMNALKDEPITIWGSGEQTVDLTYSSDVARAFVALMKSPPKDNYEVVEVGTGVPVSVNQCAQTIIQYIGSKSEVIHAPMRKGETPGTVVVCSSPYRLAGGYSIWPTKLKEIVDWYNNGFVHRTIKVD